MMCQQDWEKLGVIVAALRPEDAEEPLKGYWEWRLQPFVDDYGHEVVLAAMKELLIARSRKPA